MKNHQSFKNIFFEISGKCNARCMYCTTGAKNNNPGGFIDINVFEQGIVKLIDSGIYDSKESVVGLFNWGEPLLHPQFDKILKIINKYDIRYSFSSNAKLFPKVEVNEDFYKNLAYVYISMCGFSQASYDRIHKFNFLEIRENIENFASKLHNAGIYGKLGISFHIYQFNIDEISKVMLFAKDLGIGLNINYAQVMDYWQLRGYYDNTWTADKWKEVSADIFLSERKMVIDDAKNRESCFGIDNDIVIDEYGKLVTCCYLPNNHQYYEIGDFINDDLEKLLYKKKNSHYCAECMANGENSCMNIVPVKFINQFLSNVDVGCTLLSCVKLKGFFDDSWVGQSSKFVIKTGSHGKISIQGFYPKPLTGEETITAYIDGGGYCGTYTIAEALFSFEFAVPVHKTVTLCIDNNFSFQADFPDNRILSFVLKDIICL